MAFCDPGRHFVSRITQTLLYSAACTFFCFGQVVCAQAPNTQASKTTEFRADNVSPSRTTESHTTIGNRRVDSQLVERVSPDGEYQPYSDTETETLEVNPTTTRVVVRTYAWDADRRKSLVKLTEEESHGTMNGDSHLVRTTSNADANGNLQAALREVADTKNTSPTTQEVQTTTFTADGAGGFTPSLQTRELQTHGTDQSAEVKTTTLRPDGNGNWTIIRTGQRTIKQDGKTQITDERLSSTDVNGNPSEISRTVSKETDNAAGEQVKTVETYSDDAAGASRDGDLHLVRRETSVQRDNSGEKTTEQLIEEPDPGNPSTGLRATSKITEVVQSGPVGKQGTQTFQVRDANGTFNIVAVKTRTIDLAPTAQPQSQTPPPVPPKP
jgi:hypothetical protein